MCRLDGRPVRTVRFKTDQAMEAEMATDSRPRTPQACADKLVLKFDSESCDGWNGALLGAPRKDNYE
ncbi:MAG: hypothetical protein CMO80_09640 [Verrucomicrobiales bacterium]|nr:hypothetical protein [Verrucomicrobiales bacterium]